MAAGSFTREQISLFREAFGEAEAAGLGRVAFLMAVRRCLQYMTLTSEPSPDHLASEYTRLNRMSGTGLVTWQQFFQAGHRDVWGKRGYRVGGTPT